MTRPLVLQRGHGAVPQALCCWCVSCPSPPASPALMHYCIATPDQKSLASTTNACRQREGEPGAHQALHDHHGQHDGCVLLTGTVGHPALFFTLSVRACTHKCTDVAQQGQHDGRVLHHNAEVVWCECATQPSTCRVKLEPAATEMLSAACHTAD